MAEFAAEVYQNEFLSEGATDVHAIVTVTCRGAGSAGSAGGAGGVAEIIMVDTSGSMSGRNIEAAKHAAQVAVDQILDGTWFAIVGGSHVANRAFPTRTPAWPWCRWSRARAPRRSARSRCSRPAAARR